MAKQAGALLAIAGGFALLAMGKKKKKKKSASKGATETSESGKSNEPIEESSEPSKPDDIKIELNASQGPPSDPDSCVAHVYSQVATTLAPELAQNISDKANAIFAGAPVFFISQAAQLQAYEKLAVFMVNNPGQTGATAVVAADMAPGCDLGVWAQEEMTPTGDQLAFFDSIGKMAQVVSADLPEGVGHPHPWENNITILRDGQTLVVNDTRLVGILISDDGGQAILDASPSHPLHEIDSLGFAQQKVEVSPGVWQFKTLYVIRPIMGPIGKKYPSIEILVHVGRIGSDETTRGTIVVERHPSLG